MFIYFPPIQLQLDVNCIRYIAIYSATQWYDGVRSREPVSSTCEYEERNPDNDKKNDVMDIISYDGSCETYKVWW